MDKERIIDKILSENVDFQNEVKNRIIEDKFKHRTTLTFDKRVLDKLSKICEIERITKKDYLEILIEKIYKRYICGECKDYDWCTKLDEESCDKL